MKWWRFIVPKEVEQINDTYKSNKIKDGVNDMTVNDSEMCVRSKNEAWSISEISVLRYTGKGIGIYMYHSLA